MYKAPCQPAGRQITKFQIIFKSQLPNPIAIGFETLQLTGIDLRLDCFGHL